MKIRRYEFEELTSDDSAVCNENSHNHNEKETETNGQIDKEEIEKKINQIIENTKREALKEAERLKEKGYREGFEKGYREGFEKGLKEAQEKLNTVIEEYTKRSDEAIKKLMKTAKEMEERYKELENSAADAVISIANKVIAKTIEVDREAIISMIKEALNLTESKKLKIRLNPEDAANLEERMESMPTSKDIEIVSDNSLSRGSILIEEENGNIIDAGVNAKIAQIANTIKNE